MTKAIVVMKDGDVKLIRKVKFHHNAKELINNPSNIQNVYLFIGGKYVDCLGNPMPSNIQIPEKDMFGTSRN